MQTVVTWEVRALDDLSNGLAHNVPERADFVLDDITDYEIVEKALVAIDVVLHQAAVDPVQRSVQTPRRSDSVNIRGTLALLEAARASGVQRPASGSRVYGGVPPLPTRESHPVLPHSPYAVSELAREQLLPGSRARPWVRRVPFCRGGLVTSPS